VVAATFGIDLASESEETMNNGRVLVLAAASVLSLFGMASCSSSTDDPQGGAGMSTSSGNTGNDPGTAGTGNESSGGNTGTAGTQSGTAGTEPSGGLDANCNTTYAKSGATCTMDCVIGCGFEGMGTKTCTCMGGVYTMCPCPKPAEYLGAATAPYCPGDGMTVALDDMPCEAEWDQCIGKDAVSGTTPRGCVCMKDADNADALTWFCGSTNKWFALAP
jgi:hypothetical protein